LSIPDDFFRINNLHPKLTFNLVLEYLQRSNKIIVTKDGRIVWVFADIEKLRRLLAESKKV